MIADLTGQTVLIVAVAPPLRETLVNAFASHGAIVAAVTDDNFEQEMETLGKDGRRLDALIHGTPEVPLLADLDDYSEAHLLAAVSRGAWPVFSSLLRTKTVLGQFPRHTVALSSPAVDRAGTGTDFSAAAGAVLETLCRSLQPRLAAERAQFNVIRHRPPNPEHLPARLIATPEDVANAAVALCSGLMDSMSGQVLTVDRGAGFCDNVFRLFAERAQPEP